MQSQSEARSWVVLAVVFVALVAVIASSTGCAAPHVALTPPHMSSSLAEREAWFSRHAALDRVGARTLILRDGSQVGDVHDLVPTVAPDSPTAQAVLRADDNQRVADVAEAAAIGAVVVGGSVAIAGPLVSDDEGMVLVSLLGGTAVMMLGLVTSLFAESAAVAARDQVEAAFVTWEGDARLHNGLPSSPPSPAASTSPTSPTVADAQPALE